MKFLLSKEEWPWSTCGFALCNSGWKYWSALMEHRRENGHMFTVVSCIPNGGKNSHAERWAHQSGNHVSYSSIGEIPRKMHESAVVSLSTHHQTDEEILSVLPYFNIANIVIPEKRRHELNSNLCKQISKLGFAWGLDDTCHDTEIFCSKVGIE